MGPAGSAGRYRSSVQVKVVVGIILLAMFGMYIAASVAGSNMKLSNSIIPFCAAGIVLVIFSTASSMGLQNMKQSVQSIPLVKRLRSLSSSAWFQSFVIAMTSPALILFFGLSFLNQLVRRIGLPCSKKLSAEEKKNWFTTIAMHQIDVMKGWIAADVFAKILIWIILLATVVVGGNKGTYIVLSFLIKVCRMLPSWTIVVVVFVPIGLTMFLLPPVPGTPVYLCGGVLLVPLCEPHFGAPFDPEGCALPEPRPGCDAGFWLAMLFATLLCFLMKLMAIVMQQKGIGERLGQRVSVRAAVDINSNTVKAIRHILTQPGMSPGKVMILCGGPDWPTSVFTGILGLNVFSMLYGSIPVIIIVGTSAMAGAFQYAKTKGGAYESLASVALVVGLLAQAVFLMGALYYIEDVVQKKASALKAIPDDEEVRKLDLQIAARAAARKQEIVWAKVPVWLRLLLITSTVPGLAACWVVMFLGSRCYSDFEITMDPDTVLCMEGTPENPKGWGNATVTPENPTGKGGLCTSALVKPLGWVCNVFFLYAIIAYCVWRRWAGRRTKQALAKQQGEAGECAPPEAGVADQAVAGAATSGETEASL